MRTNSKMSEQEFVKARLAAHAAGTSGIASDPLVQAALAIDAANVEVKHAIAARKAGIVAALADTVETVVHTLRRQAG